MTNFFADAIEWANPKTNDPRSKLRTIYSKIKLNKLSDYYREVNCWDQAINGEKDDADRQVIEANLAKAMAAKKKAEDDAEAAEKQMEELGGGRRGGTSKKRRQVPEGMMLGERGALFLTEKAFGWFEEPDDDDDTESGGLVLSGERATVDADEDDVKKHIHPSGKKILITVDGVEISKRNAAAAA